MEFTSRPSEKNEESQAKDTGDHISVCVCTLARPEMLSRTLDGLIALAADPSFTYEIVIVDNDSTRSAEQLVREYQKRSNVNILYDCEPEKGIPLARNRTVRNATGNFIAFIDDDEFPAEDWLHRMYHCLKKYNADGVLGPVVPHFPSGAPAWLQKSDLCERPRNLTGAIVSTRDLRTGNIILRRSLFEEQDRWFDPERRLTGGSDGEFLLRQIRKGRTFIWCDEALVYETVSEDRWPASYYLKRHFRIGTLAGQGIRRNFRANAILRTLTAPPCYALLLPFSMPAGKQTWMRVLIKLSYSWGRILSFFKLTSVQEKS